MSKRQKVKARDRTMLKNTRDGLVERNAVTGEDVRVGSREAEFDLRGEKPERETFSQVGKRSQANAASVKHKQQYRQHQGDTLQTKPQTSEQPLTVDTTADSAAVPDTPQSAPQSNIGRQPPKSQRPPQQRRKQSVRRRSYTPDSANVSPTEAAQPEVPLKQTDGKPDSPLHTESHDRLKFAQDDTVQPRGKSQRSKPTAPACDGARPTAPKAADDRITDAAHPEPAPPSKPVSGKPDSALTPDKPGKLQFAPDEAMPDTPKIHHNRKLNKAQKQADKAVTKLDKAKSKLPVKKKLRRTTVIDAESGKPKQKLRFESEVKSRAQHLKGPLPLRPVKAAGNSALAFGHRKMFQVEKENVATEAAHKGEMALEGGIRTALRHRKTAPYSKVAKLERKSVKKSINLTYQKVLSENPKLTSNPLARLWQKRKVKKDYAKAAREAQKAAKRAKKAGSVVADMSKALVGVIRRHPVATLVVLLITVLIIALMSLIGAFGGAGSGGLGGILTASYLAEDTDIDNAELSYTEWETDLQTRIAATESTYPGYDEYRYSVGEISHNPYELMAYLTAMYENFPYSAIESDLRALFNEQYSLTFTPTTETRYREVTSTDPETGETTTTQEPYDWHVMTVTLTARSFSDVAMAHMSGDKLAHYALLVETKGARQYLANPFGSVNWLPYVTSYYGYRIHPIGGVKDLHRGVDIGLPQGTEIRAGQDGTVTFAGYSGNYGNVVVIEGEKGLTSKYAHCDTMLVSAGQTVKTGDVIATVGSTGNSTGPHLHLEILKDGIYLNPAYFSDTGSFSLTANYGNPGAPMGDGSYAALMEVALRFENWPYVWGGSSPETSFDCSGLVSYCLRVGGVKDVGRLGAQGLYNICTPVSFADARPGDLCFFHSTYSAPNPVTHVGIYCGDYVMYDAGNPIGYTRIDTTYWQNHLYGFGRITPD